jgi:hypothetical protein
MPSVFGSVIICGMTSWRDTASSQAQADLDGLLGAVLPFAEQQLARHGEFFPFGAAISEDGQLALLGAGPALGARPESEAVLHFLYQGARDPASGYRAAAFAADVIVDGSDAVRVELEHRDGSVLVVLVPYQQDTPQGAITFGQMRASPGQARVWVTGP